MTMNYPDWLPGLGVFNRTPSAPSQIGGDFPDVGDGGDVDAVSLLGSNGFQWISGNGDNALWRAPNGQTVTEDAAIQYVNRIRSTSGGGTAAPTTRSVGGTLYQYDPQSGEWFAAAGGGGSGGATATDPLAQVRLQQAQTELQLKQQNLDFLRQKFDFEMAQGMRTEARQTQNQMFQQQMDVTRLNFDIQQANAAQERAFRTDMANLATQIGTLAQDPGDRGKYASTVLANSGWGADNSQTDMRTSDSLMPLEQLLRIRQNAMGGPKPITANMPMPFDLGGMVSQGAPAPAGQPNPYAAFNAIAAQQNATGTNTAGFNVGANATPGGFPLDAAPQLANPNIMAPLHGDVIPRYAGGTVYNVQERAIPTRPPGGSEDEDDEAIWTGGFQRGSMGLPFYTPPGFTDQQLRSWTDGFIGGMDKFTADDMESKKYWNPTERGEASAAPRGLPALNAGTMQGKAVGTTNGAYISGDAPGNDPSAGGARPELNIPIGPGKAVVLNEEQMDALGINLKRVMKMAAGGIFDGLGDDDRSLATGFLDEASRRQRTNTPWEGGGQLPSPVFGSSPGFDPLVLELLASMNAMERGYPAAAYKRQAALLRPQGVSERVTRRTA